jgi:hypothetical protein
LKLKKDVTGPSRALQTVYKKKLKDTLTLSEVTPLPSYLSIAMTASQTRIAETIDSFYGEAGMKDNVSAYYRQAVEDLDAETVKELVIPKDRLIDI